jgi:glucan phosphorylase
MELYRILESEVVPEHYERDAAGLPARWVERMRRAMATSLWNFASTRMLHEYTEHLYLPAAGITTGGNSTADQEVEARPA